VGAGERDGTERRLDGDADRTARLAVARIGQPERRLLEDGPTTHDGVAEGEAGIAPEVAGAREGDVATEPFPELSGLVQARPAQRLLEADQVGIQALDPRADAPPALGPGPRVVPQVEREDGEGHGARG